MRVAINGYGRIGRNVVRALFEAGGHPELDIVAVNDLGAPEALAHLTRYDSTHGRFGQPVAVEPGRIVIAGRPIRLLQEPRPERLPWRELGVDVVLECTGRFRARADASLHLDAGAGKVIIGAAPFDEVDATVVYGVNHRSLAWDHRVISSVSCTTHALVPLVKILDEAYGVESGLMTEIHAVTSDQVLLDHTHRDLRRGRAAMHNIIPTTSSSIAALKRVLPHMEGRIDGYSVRVPTENVAAIDFTFVASRSVTVEGINALMAEKAKGEYADIMDCCTELLVSGDFNHSERSLVFDATETRVVGRQAKVLAWYDNEWGYAHRLLDLCSYMAGMS